MGGRAGSQSREGWKENFISYNNFWSRIPHSAFLRGSGQRASAYKEGAPLCGLGDESDDFPTPVPRHLASAPAVSNREKPGQAGCGSEECAPPRGQAPPRGRAPPRPRPPGLASRGDVSELWRRKRGRGRPGRSWRGAAGCWVYARAVLAVGGPDCVWSRETIVTEAGIRFPGFCLCWARRIEVVMWVGKQEDTPWTPQLLRRAVSRPPFFPLWMEKDKCAWKTSSFCQRWKSVVFQSLKSCPTFCYPKDCSTPAFPILHHLPELAQTHIHWIGAAILPSHPLSSPSPAFNLFQQQGLFQWVGWSHQMVESLWLSIQIQNWCGLASTNSSSVPVTSCSSVF